MAIHRLFERARVIAVVGASPRGDRHSRTVTAYLRCIGYDVVPVRPDLADVAGLKSYARIEDIPGPVDLAIIYRRAEAAPAHVEEAARKGVEAVWLPPGASSHEAELRASEQGIPLVVKDRCPEREHRHGQESSGHPSRLGIHLKRRKRVFEDNRKRPIDVGSLTPKLP